tara:strand:- start:68 stop:586 length:519 start_codon:yes stop_codon:yes gene_type:complete
MENKILMHSFEVFEISIGPALLGISRLPGLQGNFLADIEKIFNWKPATIISLTEEKEMKDLGASDFISFIAKEKIPWLHFPIKDFGILDEKQEVLWKPISKNIHQKIKDGDRLLLHCRGGCGRTGMIVLRIMIEFGEDPDEALERLRKIRPCAVETKAQENWARLLGSNNTQ